MELRYLPFAASAVVAGRSFVAALPRPVTGRRMHLCYNADNSSSSPEKEGESSRTEAALRRLAELDAQLEGLKEPKIRPPPPPPPPAGTAKRVSDELPEMTPAYIAFSTAALFIFTIFTNVVFNLYIKPSVDGVEQPVRTQRVPLADPGIQQPGDSSSL